MGLCRLRPGLDGDAFGGEGDDHAGAGLGVRYEHADRPLRFDVAGPVSGDNRQRPCNFTLDGAGILMRKFWITAFVVLFPDGPCWAKSAAEISADPTATADF